MSDEKPPLENQAAAENAAAPAVSKSTMPPAVALAFVIIALLGVLIVMVLRGNRGLASGSPEVTQLQAADKDLEIKNKNAEILRLEQLSQSYAAETKRLNDELRRALVSGSETDLLRRDLAATKAKCDALTTELAALRAKGEGIPADEYADLKRRYEEAMRAKEFFEAKVKELEGDLSKAKLFASSENELLPAAVELFRSLRKLEGKADSEISTAYSSLGVSLGANVLLTLNFATGSAGLTPEDQEKIRALIADIPDGDMVLSIGYASETGNVDSNRTLSSDRATAAAELFSSLKRPGQLVQAVYLGQTDRFSSRIPERNQIVEIWRIRKKQ